MTPTRMAVVTKTISSVGKDVEKLEASYSVGNIGMEVPKKIKYKATI